MKKKKQKKKNSNSSLIKVFWGAKGCLLIQEQGEACCVCTTYAGCANSAQKAKESRSSKPAHLNSPVSKTDPERIKLTLQEQRLRCAQLEHYRGALSPDDNQVLFISGCKESIM